MRCEVKTCDKREPRTGKAFPGLCLGHALLYGFSKETRAEFVARQESQDMLRGKIKREAA